MPKVRDTITPSLRNIEKGLIDIPGKAYKYWKKITPIDTGNAKRRTKKSKNSIIADYEYASYLDKGSSKQAVDGMTKPTAKYVDKLYLALMRRNK